MKRTPAFNHADHLDTVDAIEAYIGDGPIYGDQRSSDYQGNSVTQSDLIRPMNHYTVFILPIAKDDGGGFLGVVPNMPECSSDGDTRLEALVKTEKAMADWLEQQQKRDGI